MISNLYHYQAKIMEVYDGDTIRADVFLGFGVLLTHDIMVFRLYGINAPEIKGEEKVLGEIAAEGLRGMIEGKEVILKTHKDTRGGDKKGKYGRWLAEVFIDGINVNEWMVQHNLAKKADY